MDFDPADLALAFQLYVVDLVVEADLVKTDAEVAFRERHWPAEQLRLRGFLDEQGQRTQRFHDAAVQALETLPKRLDREGKLSLLQACYAIAVVDHEFRLGEGGVLLMAARLLGLSDADFDAFLGAQREAQGMTAAAIDLDDADSA